MIDLMLGDCIERMAEIADSSVDAVVADPPAGIAFMGRDFDDPRKYQSDKAKARDRFLDFLTPRLAECLRVARPGARMLCWAIPRTSHWTGTAVEDAGWIVETKIYHLFGQGYPKAKSQLKPAAEEWILARKPGGKVPPLQIDACRIANPSGESAGGGWGWDQHGHEPGSGKTLSEGWNGRPSTQHPAGRWPPNVAMSHIGGPDGCRRVGTRRVKSGTAVNRNRKPDDLNSWYGTRKSQAGDDVTYADPDGLETVEAWRCVEGCVIKALDEQAGERPVSGSAKNGRPAVSDNDGDRNVFGGGLGRQGRLHNDSGGPSRFFYCSKASRKERGDGNDHPTVKNSELMKWLCKLVAVPGGIVLDPFMGSGSTGLACIHEGFGFVGIESNPDYFKIAERRIAAARSEAVA